MANEARRGPAQPQVRQRPPAVTALVRLARCHGAAAAGDGAAAIALAGSLFFSLDYQAARWRVVLYLVLTLAPFAVVAPLIGPAIDRFRGGARWIMLGTCAVRAVIAVLMVGHLDTLLLFPEAFLMLVMAKGYVVAKSAYLPTVVAADDALVAANAKLAVLSSVSAVVGGFPAVVAARLGGAAWAVAVAAVWFALAAVLAWSVPAGSAREVGAPSDLEKRELSGAGVRVAASAMGLLRATVGFLTLWIAFELRARSASAFEFGLVLGPIGAGAVVGAMVAPRLRRQVDETWMLGGALLVTSVVGLVSALVGGLVGAAMIAAAVALVSASAKLAFDALVQREAPHADHGRAFATYEARFQLLWVVGALAGVLLPFPLRLGFALVAATALAAGALFVVGRRAIAAGATPPTLGAAVIRAMSEPVPAAASPQQASTPGPGPMGTNGPGPGGTRKPAATGCEPVPAGRGRAAASGAQPVIAVHTSHAHEVHDAERGEGQ